MEVFKFKTRMKKVLSDTITPVSIYMKIRDLYPGSLLLESSDYRGNENSYSFVCIEPKASYILDNWHVKEEYPNGKSNEYQLSGGHDFNHTFNEFISRFVQVENGNPPVNGLFGYSTYDAVRYFETIQFNASVKEAYKIPDLRYGIFKYIIAINHFQNVLYIIENQFDNSESQIEKLELLLYNMNIHSRKFRTYDNEVSNITDQQYMEMVKMGKKHCHRGDVFQIVMSRQFSQPYEGDDFNLYRALRSINPSPYLFYFDYGDYRIFGSSPEAQLKVKAERAYINPIAGTFKRTGDDLKDKESAERLARDPKENSEHIMLVDLARNDLSRYGTDVKVENYREIQFYSHVIHMVSTVSARLNPGSNCIDMMTATFPAGTLSGAPKYKAMELLDKYENQARGYYGGAIGIIDFDGTFNHAIMIRTFLSKNNMLFYQAGAGIVADSKEESELQEVNNKLGALKKAIEMAQEL
ncbi:MAG: anthranilate synthase component I family protein [Bacteroidales bacterium]|nr:anthranilate synthase component I family protein [Bacteroidales bacterium]